MESQNWKHQSNAGNLLKNVNKDMRGRSGDFIVHMEQISQIAVMFLLLTLNE